MDTHMAELPIVYVPPGRYTSHTNAVVPLLLPALRASAIMGIEWTTLKFIEDAPLLVQASTFVISIMLLAVFEKRDWLVFKRRSLFGTISTVLIVIYVCIIGYSYWSFETPLGQAPFLLTDDPTRTIEATKRLASGDRARVSEAVYDLSQLLEGAKQAGSGAESLRALIVSAADKKQIDDPNGYIALIDREEIKIKAFQDRFLNTINKYKYYGEQVTFIVGRNGVNDVIMPINMLDAVKRILQIWGLLRSKNDPEVEKMLQSCLEQDVIMQQQYQAWISRYEEHLQYMRALVA